MTLNNMSPVTCHQSPVAVPVTRPQFYAASPPMKVSRGLLIRLQEFWWQIKKKKLCFCSPIPQINTVSVISLELFKEYLIQLGQTITQIQTYRIIYWFSKNAFPRSHSAYFCICHHLIFLYTVSSSFPENTWSFFNHIKKII